MIIRSPSLHIRIYYGVAVNIHSTLLTLAATKDVSLHRFQQREVSNRGFINSLQQRKSNRHIDCRKSEAELCEMSNI